MYFRHITWIATLSLRTLSIGTLSLGLAACSSSDDSDGAGGPPPFGSFGGAAGTGSTAVAGTGGQPSSVPVAGAGGSTNETGVPVTGGLAGTGGTGGTGAVAPVSTDAGLPPQPDAGTTPPGDTVGGPVGDGPSSLPDPIGPSDVARPSGTAGDISILNWAGFTGAVTYSFDDNNNSLIQNYDAMQALAVPFTYYLWTNQGSASNAVWARALADGHEIGNHTQSHNTGVCTAADINAATQFIQNNLDTQPRTMAAPEGNICYKAAAQGLFFINRGVSPAQPVLPNDNSDPLNLNCYIPDMGQPAGTFNNNVNDARMRGGWVIYVIHGFTGDGAAFRPVDLGQLTQAINYTKSLNDMWIGTMVDVGAYWLGQKAFSQATTTQNGTAKTWSWNLPGQFPPGKYIRARVDGGTLTQNGQPLIWDPHGYYEIALDAGSVTLTP